MHENVSSFLFVYIKYIYSIIKKSKLQILFDFIKRSFIQLAMIRKLNKINKFKIILKIIFL